MTLFDNIVQERNETVQSFIDKIVLDGIDTSSDVFYNVILQIFKEAWSGKKVFPASKNMFRCFSECIDLKVVFVGQDSYYQPGIADGLAFSCGLTLKEQPSLKFIFDEIQRTAYHYNFVRNPDLTRWAKQGILLMNTALTVEQGKPDSHTEIWRPWIGNTLKQISDNNENLIFVFFGKRAQGFMNIISDKHHKIKVIHPAAAAHRGGTWDCEDVFNKINNILKQSLKKEIIW